MFPRRVTRSIPLVAGAVVVGIVSGNYLFATPLNDYWRKKMEEEAAAKETDARSA